MTKSKFWNAVAAIFIFLAAYQIGDILRAAGLGSLTDQTVFSVVVNAIQIVLALLAIILVYRAGPLKAIRELGILMPVKRAWIFGILAVFPMLVAFALTSAISLEVSLVSIFAFGVFSPFAEELLFRGYIFRQLHRRAGLGFWPAAIMPSLLFGFGHLYQSSQLNELIGIVAITGLGSLFFCWIFMRWQDNLWVPFGLHCLMNSVWMIFAVDETALGGWLANTARIATVVVAIILTVYKDKIWKRLPVENENIAEFESGETPNGAISKRAAVA